MGKLKSDLTAVQAALRALEEEMASTLAEVADVHARAAGASLVPRISVCFSSDMVAACSALRVSGLEEEVATSRLEADELHCRLNDLEDRHEAFSCAVLDVVRVLRPGGLLLPDRLHSLLC